MVAYRFEDSRSGDCVARHLDGYRRILQIDGYTAYNASPDLTGETARYWLGVRRTVAAGFTNSMRATVPRWQRRRSKRSLQYARARSGIGK